MYEYRTGADTGVEVSAGALRLLFERLGRRRAKREAARSGVVERAVEPDAGVVCCCDLSPTGACGAVGVSVVSAIRGGEDREEFMRRSDVSYSVAFSTGGICQSLL